MISPDDALDFIREANAVTDLDELDTEELAVVAALLEERRSAMADNLDLRTVAGRPRDRRRAVLAFGAALVLVAAVIGAVALIQPSTEEPFVSQPSVGTFAPPSTVPSPAAPVTDQTTLPAIPSPAWTRVEHDDVVFGDGSLRYVINDVAYGDGRFVAVGYIDDGDPPGMHGAAWVSADGSFWTRVPHDDGVFGTMADFTSATNVIALQDGYLATLCGEGFDGLIRSYDGIHWSIIQLDPALFFQADYEELLAGWSLSDPGFGAGTAGLKWSINGTAVSGGRLVLVGSAGYGGGSLAPGVSFDGDQFAFVLTSFDATTWTRVPHDESVFGGLQDGRQYMTDVVAVEGGFVAVGADGSGGDLDAAVWFSPDGLTWTRVAHDEAVFGGDGGPDSRVDQVMTGLAATPDGVLAVGIETSGLSAPTEVTSDDADGAVWFSGDGLNWIRIQHDEVEFGGPGDQSMCCVVAGQEGFVAVGTDRSSTESYDPYSRIAAVWQSTDGSEWVRSGIDGLEPGSFMTSVTAGDGVFVAVGAVNDDTGGYWDGSHAAVWVRK